MKILLAYSHDEYTTATYFERSLRKEHKVLFCGTSSATRPEGYPPFVELQKVINNNGFEPDLYLYIDSGGACFPVGIEKLKCPTACLMIDMYPYSDIEAKSDVLRLFDYAFVAQKFSIDQVKKLADVEASWLPLACDPEIHQDYHSPRIYDIGFVGGTGGVHSLRGKLLKKLSLHYKVNDYQNFVVPSEMARIYSQSKIVFNGCTRWQDINMRVFEGPACGALLITPHIENGFFELFKDGEHLVAYHNEKELFDKVKLYLHNEEERNRIAMAGREHVIKHHTYDARVKQMLASIFIENQGIQKCSLRKASTSQIQKVLRPYLTILIIRDTLLKLRISGFDLFIFWRLVKRFFHYIVIKKFS